MNRLKRRRGLLLTISVITLVVSLFGCNVGTLTRIGATTIRCATIANKHLVDATRLVVFGELHGTVESPMFVSNLTCAMLLNGESVVLGLELPSDMQSLIDDFIDIPEAPPQIAKLQSHPFWSGKTQVGKGSTAMWALIESIRKLKQEGYPVTIHLFDETGASDDRESKMADRIRALMLIHPNSKVIILTGNLHSRNSAGLSWKPSFVPMTFLLKDLRPLTFDLAFSGGKAWGCTSVSACGPRSWKGTRHQDPSKPVGIYVDASVSAHDGYFWVKEITPSEPLMAR